MSISVAASSRFFARVREVKAVIAPVLAAVVGFVMSGASIMQTAAPFAVAWSGAVPPSLALPATLGSALGYLILLKGEGALRYMACLLLTLALRWALSFIPKKRVVYYSPLFAAASVATTGLAIAVMDKGSAYGFIIALCETLITATSSILFGRAQRSITDDGGLTHTDCVCMGIFFAALYMGLCSVTVFSLSPAAILAMAAVICGGCFARAGISCVIAVCAGICSALAGNTEMLAVYCAGGLAAGIFAPFGRLGCCFSAFFACILAQLAQSGFQNIRPFFAEVIAACAIAAVIPASLLRKTGLISAGEPAEGEMLRRLAMSSISRLRDALEDIAETTEKVSKRVSEIGADPIESVLSRSCSDVCRGCENSPHCWQTCYSDTQDALGHIFAAAKKFGSAKPGDIPEHFQCRRKEELLSAINRRTLSYSAHRNRQRASAQLRSVSGDQFGGMGELLDSLQKKLIDCKNAPYQATQAVERYLNAKNCDIQSICCYRNGGGISVLARAPAHKVSQLMTPQIAADLSELTAQELGLPTENIDGSFADILWNPKAQFKIEYAFLQRAAEHNRLCGDSCRVIDQSDNRAIMLLCDGMGVGGPAAVDATMTVSLIERLLTSGAEFAPALKLANAALLSGGGDERLCTVDTAIFDLVSGRLELFKAGAAPTYICRDRRCSVFETQSLPAGILGGAQAQRITASLAEGDLIVMLSDGLLEDGGEWLPSQITALCEQTPAEICEGLIETARLRRITHHEDDMTVIAAKVQLL